MKKLYLLGIFCLFALLTPVAAQKKTPPPDDWMDRLSFNWKYREWGNYVNLRYGVRWNLGNIAPKISSFWKITNQYKKGTVSVLRMTHHAWSLDMDAYPDNANVTGAGGAVIYTPGQTPKKTIEIYLPQLKESVAEFKELGDVDKAGLFYANKDIKAVVQRFSGKPVTLTGDGKKETSQDTFMYEFWVVEKGGTGYQYVIRVSYPEIYKDPKRAAKVKSIKRFQREWQLVLAQFDFCKIDKKYKDEK